MANKIKTVKRKHRFAFHYPVNTFKAEREQLAFDGKFEDLWRKVERARRRSAGAQ